MADGYAVVKNIIGREMYQDITRSCAQIVQEVYDPALPFSLATARVPHACGAHAQVYTHTATVA